MKYPSRLVNQKTKVLSLIAAIVGPIAFGQQPLPPPPLISTNGSAEVRVVPDLADLYFEVEVRSDDLSIARKQQSDRATKLLAALRAAGVAEAELQSSQVSITPDYMERRQETDKVRFYRVSQSICCTLHDVKKVPDITAAAVAAGATGVRDASLRTSQLRKYRDEARAKAVQAAKEKAVALATELGVKVGKPYTITEGTAYAWSSGQNILSNSSTFQTTGGGGGQSGDDTKPTFAPGTISINASIAVSFVLE